MVTPSRAVFLSYASEDADAAQRVADALRAAGVEVWFDKSELRGGDAWDRHIRERIQQCRLFIAIVSRNSNERDEGYFRREWRLAVDRTLDMEEHKAFLVPVAIDETTERSAAVPDAFRHIQWTRLPRGEPSPEFVERIAGLLAPETPTPGVAASTRNAAVSRADAASGSKASQPGGRSRWIVAGLVAVAALIAVASIAWLRLRGSSNAAHGTAATPKVATMEKSIAVLPFTDLSDTHDQEYFADGLAEEILDELAKVPQLRVISRTSSFQLKGQSADVRAVGAKLGVAHVLEGSVRQSAGNVRVTAQLIQTSDGTHNWSETYDRPRSETLTLQRQIASQIASALDLTLRATTDDAGRTGNVAAHELYLRGIHVRADDKVRLEQAMEYFRRALEMDPSYQSAAEDLLWSQLVFVDDGFGDPGQWEQVRAAARNTLQRFPRSAAAHLALARVHEDHDWNWDGARRQVGLARQLGSTEDADFESAAIEGALGHWAESVPLWRRVLLTSPLSGIAHRNLGTDLQSSQQYREATNEFQRALEIDPNVLFAHSGLAGIYLVLGQPEPALREAQKENSDEYRQIALACVQFTLGHERESRAAVEALVKSYGDKLPYGVAAAHACRGDADRAFEWLERALTTRDPDIVYIKSDWPFDGIRGSSRYASLLRQVNLPN